jgi:FKBP-type peptidyl-prolyl cis-trans isomerase SlyD
MTPPPPLRPVLLLALVGLLCLVTARAPGAGAEEPAAGGADAPPGVVADGRHVTIEYTLKLDDGTVKDTNVGEEPLTYQQGGRRILPGLQKALLGMKTGETRSVVLAPKEGYGERKPDAYRKMPLASVPEGKREVGAVLNAKDGQGNRHRMRVHKITDDEVVMDLNHPLAGETLHFDVKILDVE